MTVKDKKFGKDRMSDRFFIFDRSTFLSDVNDIKCILCFTYFTWYLNKTVFALSSTVHMDKYNINFDSHCCGIVRCSACFWMFPKLHFALFAQLFIVKHGCIRHVLFSYIHSTHSDKFFSCLSLFVCIYLSIFLSLVFCHSQ